MAGPQLDFVCQLVLDPGRSFTSVQIRESFWGLGRQPITSGVFRNSMVALRKAFGPAVVVTDRYRYELTDAVISDLDLFRAALEADDYLSGPEEALALVRGPVLHGSFDGKKNSPFAWAVGIANDIEDRITTTADDLAQVYLDLDDPAKASRAIAQGLLCADSNVALRKMDFEVGAALGGTQELGRRLEAARAAMATFPDDVRRPRSLRPGSGLGGRRSRLSSDLCRSVPSATTLLTRASTNLSTFSGQACDLDFCDRVQRVLPARDSRRFGAGPSLPASSVAAGATAAGLVVIGFAFPSGSEALALLAGAFAPHLTRRSVPARGIDGIDEASSLPLMGSAQRDGAVGQ